MSVLRRGAVFAAGIVVVLIALAQLVPFYVAATVALKPRTDLSTRWLPPTGLYLGNFVTAIERGGMLTAVGNSVIVTVAATALVVVAGALAGYPLARRTSRWNTVVLMAFVGSLMIPPLSILVPIYSLMNSLGGVNTYWGIVLIMVSGQLPLSIFLYASFIKAIPASLEEAALLDGANRFQIFVHVIMPLLKPVTATVVIITGVFIWNDYQMSLYMLTTKQMRTIAPAIGSFFSQQGNNLGAAAAASLIGVIPVVIAYLLLQKQFMKGMLAGAEKDDTDDPTLEPQDASGTVVADIDPDGGRLTVRSATTGRLLLDVPLDPQIDVLGSRDDATVVQSVEVTRGTDEIRATLSYSSAVWAAKVVHLSITANRVTYRVEVTGNDLRITDARLLASTTAPGRTLAEDVYVPRFDWFEAQVQIPTDADDTLAAQQWLSPPPLVYVFGSGAESFWVAAAPRPGAFTMHSFDYTGSQGVSFRLTYEGHTRVDGTYSLPEVVIGFGDGDGNAGVAAAVSHLRATGRLPEPSPRPTPAWWREPIFCGWGQMRFDYRRDHAGHENGTFINVTSYCTELRYRNYLAALDEAGIDPGTIVIDMGWAKDPALGVPDPDRWGDMRAFIDEQHARGRRVLLWHAPVVHQGLPAEACMTLDGVPVAPDPTSAAYASILAEQVRLMISPDPGCLDADGFKIDFTQCVASESGRFVSRIPTSVG